MIDRSKFGPTPGPRFEPAAIGGPFSGPPAAARALALALGCPDLFLIDAHPGPDRDGFAAALAATGARAGRTVLLVAPDGTAADSLLSHLSADRDPPAARALAPDDRVDGLPDTVRPRTTAAFRDREAAEHQRFVDEARTGLRAAESAAEACREELSAKRRDRDRLPGDPDVRRSAIGQRIADARDQLAGLAGHREPKGHFRSFVSLLWKGSANGTVERRIATLEEQIAGWEGEIRGLNEQSTLTLLLDTELTQLAARVERCEADAAEARRRLESLGGQAADPVHPIVVAPLSALDHDPATRGTFDTVVLTHAERITTELLDLLQRRSSRCVLVGSRFARLSGSLFADLFADRDTGKWVAEAGRLVYRARSVPGHRRNDLRSEPLADRPEIELRFLAGAAGDVELAEVVFPGTVSAAEAQTWLAAELDLQPVTPCGPHHWHDGPGPIRACWHLADTVPEPPKAWAELGRGIKALVVGEGADAVTAAVTFDAEQWGQPAAEAWLADALGIVPPRAVRLPRVTVAQPAAPNLVPLSVD